MSETARKAEVDGSFVTFEFRGEKFSAPTEYADYSLEYIEAASDGRPVAVQMRALLGPDQWKAIRAMNLNGRDLDELEEIMRDAMGVSTGNSEASSA